MKHKHSNFAHERERDSDLMRAYREQIAQTDFIHIPEIFHRLVEMPSRRFWVSEDRAAVVVAALMKGHTLHNMRPTKREMFREIYRRVLLLRDSLPQLSLAELVAQVITQPAPRFYLTPGSAKAIFYRIRKKHRHPYTQNGKTARQTPD